MKRWIKYGTLGAAGLAAVVVAALLVAAEAGERKSHRRVNVDVRPLSLASSETLVQRGRYLYLSRGCTECHGSNGAGKDVVNDGKGMLIHAPNITPGGAVVARYDAADWVRTIRHGVKPSGEPVIVMPSEEYNRLTDDDLKALVAYVRQMPPATGPGATVQLPMLVKVLYGVGIVRDAAEKIDHTKAPPEPVAEAVTAAHGAYVANACIGCHGAALSGGKIPGAPPDWPAAANLTPGAGTAMSKYPDAGVFMAMLRSGKRPDGSAVSTVMPFAALKELSDTDARAIYLYLKTLPATAQGANPAR